MKNLIMSVTKRDMAISYFSGTGGGGQHRNKHQNCVKLKHVESGVQVTGQSNKERISNLREAINNLAKHPKFRAWLEQRAREIEGSQTLDEIVAAQMSEENVLVEVKNEEGRWVAEGEVR